MRDGGCGQGIQDVVTSRGGGSKVAERFAPVGDTKECDFAIDGYVAGDPLVVRGKAIGFDRAKRLFSGGSQGRTRLLGVAPDHYTAATRNQIYQTLERQLIDVEVGVNVGVIVLQ